MSEENVQIVRQLYDAWERDDIDWIVEHSDPEIVIVQPPEVPDAKSYVGHAGVVETFQDWPKQWDELRVNLVDVIDVSDTQAISVTQHHLKARGIEFDQEVAYLHTFGDDGLAIRVEMYFSRDQAVGAAGPKG